MEKTVMERLLATQAALKAPKSQENKFGGYKYRSCEDILEAVKPLLAENGLLLLVTDEPVVIADRVYIKATATVCDAFADTDAEFSVTAYAREADAKKGMDEAQLTGCASSYARKYALNGLFLIDDTKDADATNDHGKGDRPKPKASGRNEAVTRLYAALGSYADRTGGDIEALKKGIKKRPDYEDSAEFYNRVAGEFEAA